MSVGNVERLGVNIDEGEESVGTFNCIFIVLDLTISKCLSDASTVLMDSDGKSCVYIQKTLCTSHSTNGLVLLSVPSLYLCF